MWGWKLTFDSDGVVYVWFSRSLIETQFRESAPVFVVAARLMNDNKKDNKKRSEYYKLKKAKGHMKGKSAYDFTSQLFFFFYKAFYVNSLAVPWYVKYGSLFQLTNIKVFVTLYK